MPWSFSDYLPCMSKMSPCSMVTTVSWRIRLISNAPTNLKIDCLNIAGIWLSQVSLNLVVVRCRECPVLCLFPLSVEKATFPHCRSAHQGVQLCSGLPLKLKPNSGVPIVEDNCDQRREQHEHQTNRRPPSSYNTNIDNNCNKI